jgi:hypothetical protein
MPSTRSVSVAVVGLVVLAGCSALPGVGGGGSDAPAAPDRHDVLLVSDTDDVPYNGTITVEKDGEVLASERISPDGSGTYANLTSLTEPGPYTVTVNTSIPAAGGDTLRRQFEVSDPLGTASVIDVTFLDASLSTFPLPQQALDQPVYYEKGRFPLETTITVTHEGETVYADTSSLDGEGPFELTTLPETGAYRVTVDCDRCGRNGRRTAETVVLTDPASKLVVRIDGIAPVVEVLPPDEPAPR